MADGPVESAAAAVLSCSPLLGGELLFVCTVVIPPNSTVLIRYGGVVLSERSHSEWTCVRTVRTSGATHY